jgi:ATP-dependent helicase HrpA
VPEFATRMMTELERAERAAPLLPQLAQAVTRGVGQPVRVEDFDSSGQPAHLQMNFRIVDDAGQELASGRDLVALRAQLGEAAQITFRDASEDRPAIEKSGISKWDFGDLPEKITFTRQGQTITGYPALTPEEDTVAIRLFDTAHAAEEAHRQGVLRLLSFELKEQLKQLPKCFPNFNQFAIQLRSLGNSDDLMDDLVRCISDRAFLGEDALPRKKKDFDEQKNRAKTRLPAVRDAAWRVLGEVTAEYVALQGLLAKPGQITHELKAQLGQTVYKGFLSATPWEQLPRLPVYLKAMKLRSDKRTANPARDAQRAMDVENLWNKWETELKKWEKDGRDPAPLLPFRWMIEELRVGLFAQELRTPYPVSGKRLQKAWEEITRR